MMEVRETMCANHILLRTLAKVQIRENSDPKLAISAKAKSIRTRNLFFLPGVLDRTRGC